MADVLDVVLSLLGAGFAVIVAAYIVSLLLHKRMIDGVQTTIASTLQSTVSLISTSVYYGAYERSEVLRTIASIIGIDQVRDTALTFQQQRLQNAPYSVEVHPSQVQSTTPPKQ